jgi:ribonuclease VapC
MVIDASAIVAVLRAEPGEDVFRRALASAPVLHMSPVNWFEVSINAEQAGRSDLRAFETLSENLNISVVPVDEVQMRLALKAWRKYGKGRHKARLNMGDCFAYALAKSLNEPLLFRGNDFPHTDVIAAV